MAGRGRRDSAEKGRERGPGGPGAHLGDACGVGLAGGRPAAANLVARTSVFRRGIRRNGGDSGRGASILRARRKRAASQTFLAQRRSKGRRIAAALGGELGTCRVTAASGDDSRRFRPIPWARKKRAARRSSWAPRRSLGRRLAAVGGVSHGSELGLWEFMGGRASQR
jgi:hypothetical protein